MDATTSIRHSLRFLRGLLVCYWLGSSAILTLVVGAVILVERHREILYDAQHTYDIVAASLAAPMSAADRQAVIRNYVRNPREDELDGMNILLVLDDRGRVVVSSHPAWIGLPVTDPQIAPGERDDDEFREVTNCFLLRRSDCMDLTTPDLRLQLNRFTVVRPLFLPQSDIGLAPRRYLVIVNFDGGVVFADYSHDLAISAVLVLLIAGALSLLLWYLLSSRLLPDLIRTSHVDGLTQLMNRSMFMERSKLVLAEADERNADYVFAILDIDYFKKINDTYGHGCGDAALQHVAELFRTVIRPDDLVCRFGGEEFALLLNCSRSTAGRALDRLRLQLEMRRLSFAGHSLGLQASIGAASTSRCGYNIDYLYSSADKALYVAKNSGRNRLEWNDGHVTSRLAP